MTPVCSPAVYAVRVTSAEGNLKEGVKHKNANQIFCFFDDLMKSTLFSTNIHVPYLWCAPCNFCALLKLASRGPLQRDLAFRENRVLHPS